MKSSALRQTSLSALILGIAACGAGDRSAPSLPTSVQVVPTSGVVAPGSSPGISMPVTSQGTKPAGFDAVFRVDPKPDVQGIIHGDSPLLVEFDLCRSRTEGDKNLSYLYDWDFDHVADVVGTGDDCLMEHRYRRTAAGKGNELLKTNVCVVSGDPRVHGPGTYFSCRTFRISLPPVRSQGACGLNDVSFAGHCYYLDGSGGACDPGYALASQSVLTDIAPLFAGLTYKHTVSSNCCIWNADPDEDWGMNPSCNQPGPFDPGEPALGGAGCTNAMNFGPQQLTLCGN